MVTALIFAGGTGTRMKTKSQPKQFLEMHNKPIIAYVLEHFQENAGVDRIIVVCLEDKIEYLKKIIRRYEFDKVIEVVPGGDSGHESIYNGMNYLRSIADMDEIVLLHDGVRPLIEQELIDECIESVIKHGTAIAVEAVTESVAHSINGSDICEIQPRQELFAIKAPQGFKFNEIIKLYDRAKEEERIFWDAASMCMEYGLPLHMVKSTSNNIKITEPSDYYVYRALYDLRENKQILEV